MTGPVVVGCVPARGVQPELRNRMPPGEGTGPNKHWTRPITALWADHNAALVRFPGPAPPRRLKVHRRLPAARFSPTGLLVDPEPVRARPRRRRCSNAKWNGCGWSRQPGAPGPVTTTRRNTLAAELERPARGSAARRHFARGAGAASLPATGPSGRKSGWRALQPRPGARCINCVPPQRNNTRLRPEAMPRVVPGLPGEFVDYFRGSVAWHQGKHRRGRGRLGCKLLERPQGRALFQVHLGQLSCWAKSWEEEDPGPGHGWFPQGGASWRTRVSPTRSD